ncbi:hypothetical protein CC2G_002687 [Coprinopsis cinerea AmutBmut pab1-1]|nr:hypothetical protein CC2G_002687 [Coprinopsis cinerea AmutBmut pab1-1]
MSGSTQTPRKEATPSTSRMHPPKGAKLRDRAAAGFILSIDALRKWASKISDPEYDDYDPDEDLDGEQAYGEILRHLEEHTAYREAVIHFIDGEREGEFMLVTQIKWIKGVQGWEGMPKELLPLFEEEAEEEGVRERFKVDGLDENDFRFDSCTLSDAERWVIGQPFDESHI